MKKLSIKIMVAVLAVVVIASCGKQKKETALNNANDTNTAEDMFSEVFDQVSNTSNDIEDEQFKTGMGYKSTGINSVLGLDTTCADVYWSIDSTSGSESFVDSISITFTNCTHNGRIWNGTVSWSKTARWYKVGSKTIVRPTNLTIDGNKVMFTKTITCTEATISLISPFALASYNVEIVGGKVITTDGRTITWESSRVHKLTWDNTGIFFTVSGTANGTNRNGVDYTITITKDLLWKALCQYVTEGTFDIVTPDNTLTIDFGDGTCDNKATYSINGKKAREFSLDE